MLEILSNICQRLQEIRLIVKLFLQGVILVAILAGINLYLDGVQKSFMVYMPPIGFALLMFLTYFVQPVTVGVVNIFLINLLYGTKGWQVEFWLNGIFLVLVFSSVSLILQTVLGLPLVFIVLVDLMLLALPYGCIARFSNGGWKKPLK